MQTITNQLSSTFHKKELFLGPKRLLLPEMHVAAMRYEERLRREEQEDNPPEAISAVEEAPACLQSTRLPKVRVGKEEAADAEDAGGETYKSFTGVASVRVSSA